MSAPCKNAGVTCHAGTQESLVAHECRRARATALCMITTVRWSPAPATRRGPPATRACPSCRRAPRLCIALLPCDRWKGLADNRGVAQVNCGSLCGPFWCADKVCWQRRSLRPRASWPTWRRSLLAAAKTLMQRITTRMSTPIMMRGGAAAAILMRRPAQRLMYMMTSSGDASGGTCLPAQRGADGNSISMNTCKISEVTLSCNTVVQKSRQAGLNRTRVELVTFGTGIRRATITPAIRVGMLRLFCRPSTRHKNGLFLPRSRTMMAEVSLDLCL